MLISVGTNDWRQLTSTTKGLKAVTQWLMTTGLLGQFNLAADQLYGINQARDEDIDEANAYGAT